MAAVKFSLDNLQTLERSAVFPTLSRAEVTTRQKFQTLHLTPEFLHGYSARYNLLVSACWDLLFHFHRALRTIFAKVALSIASALVLRAQFHETVLLAFVQFMVTVIRMTNSLATVTTRKAELA